jgi:hypothetical protein
MVTLASIRTKLHNKIFLPLGSDTIVTSLVSSTTDSWGYKNVTYASPVTVQAIPYNLMKVYNENNPLGVCNEGEVDIVFEYDVSIGKDDKVTTNSKEYKVKQIYTYPLDNGVAAQLVRLSEIISE